MFIFEKAPCPSCHASTLVEHEAGKLLAAWFGGKGEGASDVQIWSSTFDGKAWSEPAVLGSEPGQPCWNPVLFKTAKGTLFLCYKAGPKPDNWTGFVRSSHRQRQDLEQARDDSARGVLGAGAGQADSARERHRPRRNVRREFPQLDALRGSLHRRRQELEAASTGFNVPEKFGQIQPTLFEAKDGKIVALMRSRNPRFVCRAESKDSGESFSAAEETTLLNPSAGIDVVKTKEGDVFLIYNPTQLLRTPISLARSTDDGKTWKKVVDLETEASEFSYPAMIQASTGNLEITYTWKRTHIKHVSVDPKKYRE